MTLYIIYYIRLTITQRSKSESVKKIQIENFYVLWFIKNSFTTFGFEDVFLYSRIRSSGDFNWISFRSKYCL